MNDALHMIQMEIDRSALVRFLASEGLNHPADEDLGYGIHAWLRAAFAEHAPQPFRFFSFERRDVTRILGYAFSDADSLRTYARTFALPAVQAVCESGTRLVSAEMPSPARFGGGRRLGYELLACPIARRSSDRREKDFFLHACDHAGSEGRLAREEVYGQWLKDQLAEAAEVKEVRLSEFRLVKQVRRGPKGDAGERPRVALLRPRALLRGSLVVRDPVRFWASLAHGVGRHRAFGYGMLLLKPA